MNAHTITCPEFLSLEQSIIDDFVSCTNESCDETELLIKAHNRHGGPEYVHRLFRGLHSLKGNCQMVGLAAFTEPLHKIEEIVARLRSHKIPYVPCIGEFILLATDEIDILLNELIKQKHADNDRRLLLCHVSDKILNELTPDNISEIFGDAIAQISHKARAAAPDLKQKKVALELPDDMELMRMLSLHIDNLSIYRRNRSDQIVQLIEQLNAALNLPVDPKQLRAAALMHDVGMSFIPHNIFNKDSSLTREEIRKVQEHVLISSQLLLRFGGWEEAAKMVLAHHERFDGTGYPNGVVGHEIHPGGHMLSIVDTFCSITNERSDRTFKKSLLSAISEINANIETQFDPDMVHVFNEVVRSIMLKTTN